MNIFKTAVLLTALTLLLVWVGGLLGGRAGMMYAFVFALIMNFVSYWFSDKIVLMMYRAQAAKEEEVPAVYRIVRDLGQKTGLPMPRIYIIPTPTPNAFATGRNPGHAVVAVTDGILRLLNEAELEGVLAHEMAHVKNRDILIATIVATIAGAIFMLADMARWSMMYGNRSRQRSNTNAIALLLVAILAPIAAMLIQLAISRSEEYRADETGARFCKKPLGLANALKKLQAGVSQIPMQQGSPTTAHMFIINPFKGRDFAALFMTHPPTEKRIARLEALVGKV
jgi:heat shock protein HtpX